MWPYRNNNNLDRVWKILTLGRFSSYYSAMWFMVFGLFLVFLVFNFPRSISIYFGDGFWFHFQYLMLIVFQFISLLWVWVCHVPLHYLRFFIFTLINTVPAITFGTYIILFMGDLVSLSVTLFSHLFFNMFGYFMEFLRAIVIISIYPSSYYEVRRRGVRLNTIFGFRPLASRSLSSAGVAYRAFLIMEVVLFQLLYSIFQFLWTGLLVPYYLGISIYNSMFTGSYWVVFLVTHIQRFKEVFLSAEVCIGIGLTLILFLILLVISPQTDRIQNFFNRQSLFAFVASNRWFGSNFFPDSSVFSVFARVIHVRVRAFESVLRRLESLIVFTSQLRLDPKQVDLSYW